ncbi:Fe-S protein assembly co-chaperone HscB [Rhodoferax ferrireducens]|uniref:Fe-S protein assembly co-chaperone HscB n=1 Tax=Rhodoferax ferrireducens TaxID=192843 RepID=UPI00298ECE9F|nr:Fe-S protein assembly co-chaperone HscB [Rhodoferax ferrireducens]WPC65068.1 Fe-S protein assembly co-chaperone HscB [Rhodoferax ferrireducens]
MNLQSNDFELFGLALQFAQDRVAIDARWKDLQREAHPDKFAAQGAAAQRVAMQWSVRINEAYQRLKAPLKRAAYLCELRGAAVNAENNTSMPPEFLMQQMDWREALDNANSLEDLDDLGLQVKLAMRDGLSKCERFLDHQHDYLQAAQQVRALMFIEGFERDVQARLDQMDTMERGQ